MIEFVSPISGAPLRCVGEQLIAATGESFPVAAGIPRFIDSEVTPYTASFGLQWKIHALTQLDTYTGKSITRDRLERCLGMKLEATKGLNVLEAGCGAGRFTELFVQAGALTHSFDASEAVEANAANIGSADNYRICQASLLSIPFPDDSFDIVVCLGVLQHTPSPEASIERLLRKVKPGGLLVIDHYRYSWTTRFSGAYVTRLFLKRLPVSASHRVVESMVKVLFPVHRFMKDKPRPLVKLFRRLSPVIDYFNRYPELSDDQQREFSVLDTYDTLTDHYKHLRTAKQISVFLRSLGMIDIEVWNGGNGVEARAVKPHTAAAMHTPANVQESAPMKVNQ